MATANATDHAEIPEIGLFSGVHFVIVPSQVLSDAAQERVS